MLRFARTDNLAAEPGAARATVFMWLGDRPNPMDRFVPPTGTECFFG